MQASDACRCGAQFRARRYHPRPIREMTPGTAEIPEPAVSRFGRASAAENEVLQMDAAKDHEAVRRDEMAEWAKWAIGDCSTHDLLAGLRRICRETNTLGQQGCPVNLMPETIERTHSIGGNASQGSDTKSLFTRSLWHRLPRGSEGNHANHEKDVLGVCRRGRGSRRCRRSENSRSHSCPNFSWRSPSRIEREGLVLGGGFDTLQQRPQI